MIDDGANPATGSVNGVRNSEQVAARLRLQATPSIAIFQVSGIAAMRAGRFHRTRLVGAGWVVVRRSDGFRRSLPVYRGRTVPIARSGCAR
jgi:hypothetical protein